MKRAKLSILYKPHLNIWLVILSALVLFIGNTQVRPILFSDSAAYLDGGFQRTWFIPFVYKSLAKQNLIAIVILQKCLHLLVFTVCLQVLTHQFKHHLVRTFISVAVFFFFGWWNIAGYTNVLLSESITFSFLFLSIALMVQYLEKRSIYILCCFGLSAALCTGCRDQLTVVMLVPTAFIFINALVQRRHVATTLLLFLVFVCLHLERQNQFKSSERYSMVIGNVIQNRILPHETLKHEFIEMGMPYNRKIDTLLGHSSWELDNYLYKEEELKDYVSWLQNESYAVYSRYLLTHPKYTFISPFKDRKTYQALYSPSLYPTNPSNIFTQLIYLLQPIFTIGAIILLLILTACTDGYKSNIWWSSLVVSCMTFVNFYLSYHGDTNEISRHLIAVSPLIQFTGILLSGLLISNSTYLFAKSTSV